MNIMPSNLLMVQYKCGCIKIANTNIFVHYCEADDEDEYEFDINPARHCEGEPNNLPQDKILSICGEIRDLVNDGLKYRRIRKFLRTMLYTG